MMESPFDDANNKPPVVEKAPVKTKQLAEGVSTEWENEKTFTAEEVMSSVQEVDPQAGELTVTEQILNHEGVIVALTLKNAEGFEYSFGLIGNHGPRVQNTVTTLIRETPTSYPETLADFVDGVWKMQPNIRG